MELAHVRLMMKGESNGVIQRLVQQRKTQHRDLFRTPLSISSSFPARSHQSFLIHCAAIPSPNAISRFLYRASFLFISPSFASMWC